MPPRIFEAEFDAIPNFDYDAVDGIDLFEA